MPPKKSDNAIELEQEADSEKVIVTGAGSGIGKELVKLFLQDGSSVLAVSLLEDELDSLRKDYNEYEGRLYTLKIDLSEDNACELLVNWCMENCWTVDTLVNNAGFAIYSDCVKYDRQRVRSMINLNVRLLTELCMVFGGSMVNNRGGNILNVGSTTGMFPTMRFASYGASKAYVNSFSASLRAELKPHNVNVTCLCPSATRTNFSAVSGIDDFDGKSLMKGYFQRGGGARAEKVAKIGYRGMRKRKGQVIYGPGSALARVLRHLPQPLVPVIMRNF
tara:strand:- start:639 stop:1469 length:831 start_codon:yes stop_codon:yes gene_type:complete